MSREDTDGRTGAMALARAERAGLLFQSAGEGGHSGRFVEVGADTLLNFASYDYLGLATREELKLGAIDATRRYGTQFPYPRAMLQSHLYLELETLLKRMTEGHVVVAASTTLAHVAALPVLLELGDAVVIEDSAHASLHAAASLLSGIPVSVIPEGDVGSLEEKLRVSFSAHRRVWFLFDGLRSLHGGLAPVDALSSLSHRYPTLNLYIDDAHSASWTGRNGRGHSLERLDDRSRAVVVLSLNKSFCASGAALVLGDSDSAGRVLRGRGLASSGAIPPPMLGAAIASARIHLSPELPSLQERLLRNIRRVIFGARERGVALADVSETPLFFHPCGTSDQTIRLVQMLRVRGLCVTGVVFPLVPEGSSGIRFTISAQHELEDVDRLLNALSDS